jgi:SAM-dependent methyltransferase
MSSEVLEVSEAAVLSRPPTGIASSLVGPFDAVVDEYESGRPGYPDALFDALEPIAELTVLEGGAGTGLATRSLLERGANLVAFDIGIGVMSRAMRSIPGLTCVVADGAKMPFRDSCADLLCFAQSWHWLDERRRAAEAARVLRPGGRWAAWWSHARADQEPWFESYWDAIEAATVARRWERDTDWGQGMRDSGLFDVSERVTYRWIRETTVDQWLAHDRSHSYVASLPEPDRLALLAEIDEAIRCQFPDGDMRAPYETYLWVATKR